MANNIAYINEWQKGKCDRINLILPKGERERLRAHAVQRGESLNGFIKRAIAETVARDTAATDVESHGE